MPKWNMTSDPEAFAREAHAARIPGNCTLCLGLDFGTSCGYAYTWLPKGQAFDPGFKHPVFIGQLDLSAGPYDTGAIRFVRLRHFLALMSPDVVFYEDVKYTAPMIPGMNKPTQIIARAAKPLEFFGALKATLAAWGEENGVPTEHIPIGDIKRTATGKGNANKEAVIAAMAKKLGYKFSLEDYAIEGTDNCADAFWCLECGLRDYWAGLDGKRDRGEQPRREPETRSDQEDDRRDAGPSHKASPVRRRLIPPD